MQPEPPNSSPAPEALPSLSEQITSFEENARRFAGLRQSDHDLRVLRTRLVISTMGFSPEPATLIGAMLKPATVVLLCTDDSVRKQRMGMLPGEFVKRFSGVEDCRVVVVEEPYELSIYKTIKEVVSRSGYRLDEILIDMTAGKKVMSASATIAANVLGIRCAYVDSVYRDAKVVPGSESPALLRNPYEVFGDLLMRSAVEHFNSGRYSEAAALFEDLGRKLWEPREVQTLAPLAKALGAMHSFRFTEAFEHFDAYIDSIECHAALGRWSWVSELEVVVSEFQRIADAIPKQTEQGARYLLLFSLARCERLLDSGRNGEAALLVYATLERAIKAKLQFGFGIGMDAEITRQRLGERVEDVEKVGKEFYGTKYQPERMFGSKPSFASCAIVLEALMRHHKPDQKYVLYNSNGFERLQKQGEVRHGSPLSHGLFPVEPGTKSVRDYLTRVRGVIAAAWGEELVSEADALVPPRLEIRQ